MSWLKYLFAKKHPDYSWIEVLVCRLEGHPNGVVWFCPDGLEPDMQCRDCGDYLG